MSPTVLRVRGYRLFFCSREEKRPHVHVQHERGEAKFWLEPEVALAYDHGLGKRHVGAIIRIIKVHETEIRQAWAEHFIG